MSEPVHMLEVKAPEPGVQSVRVNWTMAAVIMALITQAGALFVWAGRMDQRLSSVEEKVAGAEKLAETVARVDERTKAMQDTVNRLDARFDARKP